MNPDSDSLTMISETVAIDEIGRVFLKADAEAEDWISAGEYGPVPSAISKEMGMVIDAEQQLDDGIRKLFAGALANENDKVQIRVIDGRLMWIRSDRMEQKWQELTPNLADHIATTGREMKLPVEEAKKIEVQEPESYEIGWYQDVKGDLYQFDGETWVGNVPSKKEINDLEFLG